jgi:preprotein translocase subunit YajC
VKHNLDVVMLSSIAALGADSNNSGSSAISLLILPLMMVGAYFLLIRPQRRRQKEAVQMQSTLEEGDEVITTSGLYGFITGFDGEIVWLEIDDNVQIRVARQAVSRKVDTSGAPAAPAAPAGKGSTSIDDITEDDSSDK